MALKDIYKMVKADRYTADGREEVIKAQQAETEDKVYQIGEISQKTGLQKTANGWVKPKSGKAPGAKTGEGKSAGAGVSPEISKQSPEELKEIMQKGAEFRRGRAETARERSAEAAKALSEKIRKEVANPSPEIKIQGMNKNQYVLQTMMERHVPEAQAEKMWDAEVERVKKLRAESEAKNAESKPAATEPEDKSEIRISRYMDKNFAGKPNSERNAFYDFVKEKIYKSGKDPQRYLGQGGYSYPNKLLNEYLKEWQATDSAPRVLTGDTKIRVRKA